MLIAEELALVAYDDTSGTHQVGSNELEYALAGAVLAELALDEHVRVSGPDEPGVRKGRVVVPPGPDPSDALLADALSVLRAQTGRKPKDALDKLRKLSKSLHTRILDGLANSGALRRERRKVLGLFPVTRWPQGDHAVKAEIRSRLHGALALGQDPDPRTAALISVLAAVNQAHRVVELPDRNTRREAKRRGKEIAEGDWAGTAVKKALEEVHGAVAAATAAAAAGGAAGSS